MPALQETTDREGAITSGRELLRILAIGESTIAGVGASTSAKGLIGQTAQFLSQTTARDVAWKIMAQSGLTIRQVIDTLLHTGDVLDTDLILVGVGGNDVFKLNHPQRFDQDLRQLIDLLKSRYPDIPIVFTHMPPIRDLPVWSGLMRFFMSGLADILEENLFRVTSEYSQVYYCHKKISLARFKQKVRRPSHTDEFFSDGVHPSELTYTLWGEEVADFIAKHVLITGTIEE